ncbi:MAG: hypothetical protein HRU12_03380, partial [Phaeodactylibacter sp.]|nr:hypothetical protein [Phaeodactylibacter sp.]
HDKEQYADAVWDYSEAINFKTDTPESDLQLSATKPDGTELNEVSFASHIRTDLVQWQVSTGSMQTRFNKKAFAVRYNLITRGIIGATSSANNARPMTFSLQLQEGTEGGSALQSSPFDSTTIPRVLEKGVVASSGQPAFDGERILAIAAREGFGRIILNEVSTGRVSLDLQPGGNIWGVAFDTKDGKEYHDLYFTSHGGSRPAGLYRYVHDGEKYDKIESVLELQGKPQYIRIDPNRRKNGAPVFWISFRGAPKLMVAFKEKETVQGTLVEFWKALPFIALTETNQGLKEVGHVWVDSHGHIWLTEYNPDKIERSVLNKLQFSGGDWSSHTQYQKRRIGGKEDVATGYKYGTTGNAAEFKHAGAVYVLDDKEGEEKLYMSDFAGNLIEIANGKQNLTNYAQNFFFKKVIDASKNGIGVKEGSFTTGQLQDQVGLGIAPAAQKGVFYLYSHYRHCAEIDLNNETIKLVDNLEDGGSLWREDMEY